MESSWDHGETASLDCPDDDWCTEDADEAASFHIFHRRRDPSTHNVYERRWPSRVNYGTTSSTSLQQNTSHSSRKGVVRLSAGGPGRHSATKINSKRRQCRSRSSCVQNAPRRGSMIKDVSLVRRKSFEEENSKPAKRGSNHVKKKDTSQPATPTNSNANPNANPDDCHNTQITTLAKTTGKNDKRKDKRKSTDGDARARAQMVKKTSTRAQQTPQEHLKRMRHPIESPEERNKRKRRDEEAQRKRRKDLLANMVRVGQYVEDAESPVNRFEVMELLGMGGFGVVYLVKNIARTDKQPQYAMKMEPKVAVKDQKLLFEVKIMKELAELPSERQTHFCKRVSSGQGEKYVFVVMELLGLSLYDIRKKLMAADFTAPGKKITFFGTYKFCPIAAHDHVEQGPKDDVESWLYMCLDLMRAGCLPWDRPKTFDEIVYKKKQLFSGLANDPEKCAFRSLQENLDLQYVPKLRADIGQFLAPTIAYLSSLKYESDVDVQVITNLITEDVKTEKLNLDELFDWLEDHGNTKESCGRMLKKTSRPTDRGEKASGTDKENEKEEKDNEKEDKDNKEDKDKPAEGSKSKEKDGDKKDGEKKDVSESHLPTELLCKVNQSRGRDEDGDDENNNNNNNENEGGEGGAAPTRKKSQSNVGELLDKLDKRSELKRVSTRENDEKENEKGNKGSGEGGKKKTKRKSLEKMSKEPNEDDQKSPNCDKDINKENLEEIRKRLRAQALNGNTAEPPSNINFKTKAEPTEPMVKAAVSFGTACSVFVVVACVWAGAIIYNDITEMYDDFMGQMGQFRGISDDTWLDIVAMQRGKNPESLREYVNEVFGRNKRSNSQCKCGVQRSGCPAGPPGPPGIPGESGETGNDGTVGKPGQPALVPQHQLDLPQSCIKCPAGPPGEPGLPGQEGMAGMPGEPGKLGAPGNDGDDGAAGPIGDQGEAGFDGQDGPGGPPGQDSLTGKGAPGLPGRPGMEGCMGDSGKNGEPGPDGEEGPEGPVGFPGKDGMDGSGGNHGPAGPPGAPGGDGEYCNCPARKQ